MKTPVEAGAQKAATVRSEGLPTPPEPGLPSMGEAVQVALALLDEPPWNVTQSSERSLSLLVQNIREAGFNENLVIVPRSDVGSRYWILSGNDKAKAARVIGYATVPCVVRNDWDEDKQKLQTVRMNSIKKPMDRLKFAKLFVEMQRKYGEEAAKHMMSFTDASLLSKLITDAKKVLPENLQKELDKKKATIKTVDDLSTILSEMFNRAGSSMDRGYCVFSYGGQNHVYVQMDKALNARINQLVDKAANENRHIAQVIYEALGGDALS